MDAKMRAMALDAEGRRFEARLFWYGDAVEEIRTAQILSEEEDEVARYAAVGEAVASLANALRPLGKERTREVVAQFLDSVRGAP